MRLSTSLPLDEEKCIRRAKCNFMNYMEFRKTRLHEHPGNPEIKRGTGKGRSVGCIAVRGRSIAQRGEGEQRVKCNQVRTKWPHPICCERESGESGSLAAKAPALSCIALPRR